MDQYNNSFNSGASFFIKSKDIPDMVVDILNSFTLIKKSYNVQPILSQLQLYNNNNISLLVDRKLSILKLNKLVFLII